ncbi:hypothetical protein IV203_003681 [Nitzschia inconspicua]|uniref:Uncharacterized protein n=1 Tax=Nitzschia inconspicua TaxID=303405 RepID=A0A9K3PNU6_9STRA|nr:hypothetical protein IV203_003681 [Nitzschia inconspicua]
MIHAPDAHGETANIPIIGKPMKMDISVRKGRQTANSAMILQLSQTLDLVEDSPSTKHRSGSALGRFMAHLLSDALLVVDHSSDWHMCTSEELQDEPQDRVSNGDRLHNTQNKSKDFVLVNDNARLPCRGTRSSSFRRSNLHRSLSERTETKRDSRWGGLDAQNDCVAGLTAPIRNNSWDYSNIRMPSMPCASLSINGSAHKVAPKIVFPVDMSPTYPRSRRRSSA